MASRYWFARKFPVTEPKATRMSPVSTEGLMVVTFFVAALLAGAAGLLLYTLAFRAPALGFVVFVTFVLAGTAVFVAALKWRGDTQHTADEYKSGRISNS